MKKLLFSNVAVTMLMAFTASFTLSSCSEEVVEDQQENQETQEENLDLPKDAIVFTTGGYETTRTSLDLNAYFYWTANDKIWVDVDEDGSYATSSDNMEMSSDKRLARFFFTSSGSTAIKDKEKAILALNANAEVKFNLTYTGVNSTSGTKVTIPQDQSQDGPDDATSIGRNGDCATATATRNAKGQYEFTLHHEAHYLIFQPYTEIPEDKTWKLKSIEIIDLDDKPLCGTYDFGMDGLTNVQSPNSTITISTIGSDPNGVELLEKTASDKPTWYAVIAPATDGKRNLRIKYTIYPDAEVNYIGASQKTDIVIVKDLPKDYASVPNKVTKIAHKMTLMNVATDLFYTWDATAHYWTDVTVLNNRPHYYGASNTNYPTTGDSSTPLTTIVPATGRAAANAPCNGLPNVNAATWYAFAGDPRWDNEYPWCFDNDYNYIYTKGTWFKKWDVIVAENSVLAGKTFTNCDVSFIGTNIPVYNNDKEIVGYRDYDGTDYRCNTYPLNIETEKIENNWFQSRAPSYRFNGRPKDTSNYFFLPANGHLNNTGKLDTGGGIHGCFWLSSGSPTLKIAYIVETKDFNIMVRRDNGGPTQGRPAPTDWWK